MTRHFSTAYLCFTIRFKMGVGLQRMFNPFASLGKEDHARILMLGLDGAGKTTILYRSKLNETIDAEPTNGIMLKNKVSSSDFILQGFKSKASILVRECPSLYGMYVNDNPHVPNFKRRFISLLDRWREETSLSLALLSSGNGRSDICH